MAPFDQALLASVILLTAPILIAAVGEGVSERAGVLNIGLEGMVLAGAFFAFWMDEATHSFWLGVLVGSVSGGALAAIMAVLSINARANQVVAGVGIWILGQGLTSFLFEQEFGQRQQIVLAPPKPIAIPLLSRLPGVGQALFDQTALVYIAFLLVPLMWLVFYRTTWGLRIRSAGDLPDAAATAGWNVQRIRWVSILVAGTLAGLSGAFLSIGQVGTFLPGMSNGRGFLAIAAVIFGAWRPVGILVASLIFGFGDALQLRLQGDPSVPWSVWLVLALIVGVGIAISLIYRYRSPSNGGLWTSRSIFAAGMFVLLLALAIYRPDITLSAQLWLALPYVFALVALAALRRRAAVPRYLTIPFVPGGSTT